jgi:hypothetical protein
MSSDFRHIRRINDANGRTIAEVRYAEGAEQEENLANGKLLCASERMLAALKLVVEYHVPKINPLSDAAILAAMQAIELAETTSAGFTVGQEVMYSFYGLVESAVVVQVKGQIVWVDNGQKVRWLHKDSLTAKSVGSNPANLQGVAHEYE